MEESHLEFTVALPLGTATAIPRPAAPLGVYL